MVRFPKRRNKKPYINKKAVVYSITCQILKQIVYIGYTVNNTKGLCQIEF